MDEIETQIKITGEALTKDEQEILKSKGALFVREDGKIAPRHLTGFRIQARTIADNRNRGARLLGRRYPCA